MYTSLRKKNKTHHDGTSQVGRFDDYVRISLDQPLGDVKNSYITKKPTNGRVVLVILQNLGVCNRITPKFFTNFKNHRFTLEQLVIFFEGCIAPQRLRSRDVTIQQLRGWCHQRLINVNHPIPMPMVTGKLLQNWRNPGTQNNFIASQGHFENAFSYSPGGIC